MTYGDSQQEVVSKITFWVVPWRLIIGVVVALLAGFFIFRHMLRRYNRRIIQKATGKAPAKKTRRKKK